MRCSGELVPLPPKAVDTLAVLAARPGDIVSKETLMQRVWGSTAVEEANLTQHIYNLRRVLTTHDPSIRIETVPRRGYRLVIASPVVKHEARTGPRRRRLWLAACSGAVCIAVAAAALFHRSAPATGVPRSYAAGYYYWSNAHSSADVRKSIGYFDRSIVEEPRSALGYAGLAVARLSLALRDPDVAQQIADVRAGMSAAKKAVSIDPMSAEANAASGQAQALFGDPGIGASELRRAVSLDPTSVEARTWYGELLMGEGRIDEAIPQFRAAIAENSSWTEAGDKLALLSYLRRNYAEAAAYAAQSLAQAPGDTLAPFVLALANAALGHRIVAERQMRPFTRARDPQIALKARAALSLFYFEDGKTRSAVAEFSATKRALQRIGVVADPFTLISIAAASALQHRTDIAFAWLARVDTSSRRLFAGDARLDLIRQDRQFRHWVSGS